MREIILIRHGLTPWNLEHRIQGQTDVPLAEEGVVQVRRWSLPGRYVAGGTWHVSALARTRETASLLGIDNPDASDALNEMDWGSWTGRRIAELRAEFGEKMRENERRGLDFQPPGGESPRMVRRRLARWIENIPGEGGPVCVVTHKGVIRAAISLATGWDLTTDFGEKLHRDGYHRFLLERGQLRLERLNLSLLEANARNL